MLYTDAKNVETARKMKNIAKKRRNNKGGGSADIEERGEKRETTYEKRFLGTLRKKRTRKRGRSETAGRERKQSRTLFHQRNAKGEDDVLITAAPALLKASVMMLLQENVFTAKEFMDELSNEYKLSISPEEVEYLLDLPVGTLAVSKIIDFNAIQIKRSK